MLRGMVIGRLGRSGHQPTIKEARDRFKKHCENPLANALPSDVRGPAYSIVLKFGDDRTLEQMLKVSFVLLRDQSSNSCFTLAFSETAQFCEAHILFSSIQINQGN